jgi:hypothetical protein
VHIFQQNFGHSDGSIEKRGRVLRSSLTGATYASHRSGDERGFSAVLTQLVATFISHLDEGLWLSATWPVRAISGSFSFGLWSRVTNPDTVSSSMW